MTACDPVVTRDGDPVQQPMVRWHGKIDAVEVPWQKVYAMGQAWLEPRS